MNVLDRIVARRRADIETARRTVPEAALREAAGRRRHRGLADRLRADGIHVIAEMKQASPSAGRLRDPYDPAALARDYAAHGAAAVSVLTEPHLFLGNDRDLAAVRAACALPILRKDFTVDPYQVLEAAALGADAILLIAAILDDAALRALYGVARDLGLDVLAEAHNADELRRVLDLPDALIGVNSRNLKTLTTDLAVARDLAAFIPDNRLAVAESGIRTAADVATLRRRGYRGFLIGEILVSAARPGVALQGLLA